MVVFVIVLNASENERQIMSRYRRCGVDSDTQNCCLRNQVNGPVAGATPAQQWMAKSVQFRPAADFRKVNYGSCRGCAASTNTLASECSMRAAAEFKSGCKPYRLVRLPPFER